MAVIYFNFKVNTEQLGELNFSTITHDRLGKSEKFANGHESDRTVVVQILHGYLVDDNISIEDINVLNDNDIESIARQLLEKSRLIDKLDETEAKVNGFFFSFRNTYKQIIIEEKKCRANQKKLFAGGSAKILEEAFRHSKNYSFFDDIGNWKSRFNGYPGQCDIVADIIASEIRNQEKNLGLGIQTLSEKVRELEMGLRTPIYDFTSIQPQFSALSAINSANIAIADILGQQRKDIENIAIRNAREITTMGSQLKNQMDSEFFRLSNYAFIGDISLATQKVMSEILWKDMGSAQGIPFQEIKSVEATFQRLTDRYSELYHSIEDSKIDISSLEWFVIELPPLELYVKADLVRSISKPAQIEPEKDFLLKRGIKEDIEGTLEELLCTMDPGLVRMWHGAKKALKSTNPDRYRHIVISLRELVNQVLHKITPDKEVLNWISDPNHLYNGRPTREARLFYLCRKINFEPFTPFLQNDVATHLSLVQLFQRGTHELNISFTEKQMELMIVQTEALLKSLLILSRNN